VSDPAPLPRSMCGTRQELAIALPEMEAMPIGGHPSILMRRMSNAKPAACILGGPTCEQLHTFFDRAQLSLSIKSFSSSDLIRPRHVYAGRRSYRL
jgi:hypothetical protein